MTSTWRRSRWLRLTVGVLSVPLVLLAGYGAYVAWYHYETEPRLAFSEADRYVMTLPEPPLPAHATAVTWTQSKTGGHKGSRHRTVPK